MKILVTGANGFVATHIIQQLLAEGHTVVGTIRNRAKQPPIFDNVTYVVANLTSAEGWLDAMTDVEAILHVASPLSHENANNPQLIDEAISGVTIVFEAAKKAGVKRIVMTSSQAAATPLTHTTGIIDETFWSDAENPELNAYRLSKLFAEQTAWSLAQQYDLQVTTILPGALKGMRLITRFSPLIAASMTACGDNENLNNNTHTINALYTLNKLIFQYFIVVSFYCVYFLHSNKFNARESA